MLICKRNKVPHIVCNVMHRIVYKFSLLCCLILNMCDAKLQIDVLKLALSPFCVCMVVPCLLTQSYECHVGIYGQQKPCMCAVFDVCPILPLRFF